MQYSSEYVDWNCAMNINRKAKWYYAPFNCFHYKMCWLFMYVSDIHGSTLRICGLTRSTYYDYTAGAKD